MDNFRPFVGRLKEVVAELQRDYGYEDAEVEAEEVGLDTDECLVMALENRAELGRFHVERSIEVIEKLTAQLEQLSTAARAFLDRADDHLGTGGKGQFDDWTSQARLRALLAGDSDQ